MSRMLRNVQWLSLAQASKMLSQLVSIVVLARLLPPSAYGLIALAGTVTDFVGLLREMGTAAAIVQRKDMTQALADTAFWNNLGLGVVLGLLICVFSHPLASFFREPELASVLLSLAIMVPVGASTAVHLAMMERQSRFKELALLDAATQLIGLGLCVSAALLGAGVYSFVIPTVFSVCTTSIWLWRRAGWRPSGQWSREEFRSLWGFSSKLTVFNFINFFARSADGMIVGRMQGATALGQYGMACKLMLFPVQHMGAVVVRALLPQMSALQSDLEAARNLYFRVLGGIALLSAPLMLGLWALREPFAVTLLSSKWGDVPRLLAWLAPVGLIQSFLSTSGSVLTAQGKTGALMKLGLFTTATVLVGFFVGALQGLVQLAAGYFVANVINLFVTGWVIGSVLQARLGPLWREIKAPILSALAMAALLVAAQTIPALQALPAPLRLITLSFTGAAMYLSSLALVFGLSPSVLLKVLKGRT